MLVTPTIYLSTKFSPLNPPDSPLRITANYQGIVLPALDILQELISEISVKTTWQQIQSADMISLYNTITGVTWWYYITSVPTMTSIDVAKLSIKLDGILSIGGFSNLEIIGGLTVRHHVTDDSFGMYTEEDELLTCHEPLVLDTNSSWSFSNYNHLYTMMESTIDLSDMGAGQNPPCTQWTDPTDPTVTVNVPATIPVTTPTAFSAKQYNTADVSLPSPGTQLFVSDVDGTVVSTVQEGSSRCRQISAESAIISQYQVPDTMVSIAYNAGNGSVSSVTGRTSTTPDSLTDLPFDFTDSGYTVQNQRVLYGDLCQYGIITSDGNIGLFNPEMIYDFNGALFPKLIFVTDPRANGRPYFRFEYYNHTKGEGDKFWINCLPGATWRQVPLIYNSASGELLNSQKYQYESLSKANEWYNSAYSRELGLKQKEINSFMGGGQQAFSGVLGVATSFGLGDPRGLGTDLSNVVTGITDAAFAKSIYDETKNRLQTQYDIAMDSGLVDYGTKQSVVVPTIQIPGDTKILRDIKGNGCLAFRYHPSMNDLQRHDKLLTMYGYKDETMLDNSMFSSRQYFNYIQAQGVEISNAIPTWLKAVIQSQFSTGMRIWHTVPNSSYYSNNPVVVTP